MKLISGLLFICTYFFCILPVSSFAATYYVSSSGSDTNSGTTVSSPFKTIQKGAGLLNAGDILYIKTGTYFESPKISSSGSVNNPIIISGYQNEIPVIDGQNTNPSGCYDFLFSVSGSYVTIQNIKVVNSNGGGIVLSGSNSTLRNVTLDRTGETGIVLMGSNNVADSVTVHKNGQRYGNGCNTWGSALCSTGTNNVIKNSLSYENRGEGLNSYAGATGTIIQDNISYNNTVGLYLDSTTGVRAERNLIYYTPEYPSPGNGIYVGRETSPAPDTLVIINNIVLGAFLNFTVDSNVTSFSNSTIANNTFVNSKKTSSQISSGYNMNIYFRPGVGSYSNVLFANNIILEEDANQTPISVPASHNGLTFSHNLYNKSYSNNASGQGDIVADPRLAKIGTIAAGQLTGNYFKLLSNSSAINTGINLSQVTTDFFKSSRPQGSTSDIGAIEFGGTVVSPTSSPTPTIIISPTLSPTTACSLKSSGDSDCNGKIDLVDFEIWRKEFTGSLSTKNADLNIDTVVNIVDFELWRKGYFP